MVKQDIAQAVESLLSDFLAERELEVYRTEFRRIGRDWTLRVTLDKPADSEQQYVSIEECEEVTRYLSDRLDEADLIDRSYTLEVESPGLDRELLKESDFERFAGSVVEVKLYEPLNGSKQYEAVLAGKTGDIVRLDLNGQILEIPASKIAKINLAVIF
ncbi:MAG: ribosome maturation factor RimP [Mogibacterium sp.]|nr:ribosome maturation factor RimP [Mogibacterium sp.]